MIDNFNDKMNINEIEEKKKKLYNKKLYVKLAKLYGKEKAAYVYEKMQREGEEELEYLKSISKKF